MRNIYPVKYYSDEGFVEHKIELGDAVAGGARSGSWPG